MARFADINVSQGSVATCARCDGIFDIHLTANLPGNLPGNFFIRLRFDRIMVMTLWPRSLAHSVHSAEIKNRIKGALHPRARTGRFRHDSCPGKAG